MDPSAQRKNPEVPPRHSTGRNVLAMVISQLLSRALLLLAFLAAARAAGPLAFGQLSLALGALTMLSIVSDPGLHYVAQRAIGHASIAASQLVAQVSSVRLVLALIGLIGTCGIYLLDPNPTTLLVTLYAATLVPSAMSLAWAYSGVERFQVVAASSVLNAAIHAAWVLVWVKRPTQMWLVPMGLLVANGLSVGLQYVLAPPQWRRARFVPGFLARCLQLLREGLPFGLVLLLSQMLVWMDSFILMALIDARAVGIYHAAYRWILLALGFASYFPQALFPRMLRLAGSAQGSELLENAARFSLQVGTIASICLFGLAPTLVATAFGIDYREAQSILGTLTMLIPFAMHNSLVVHHLNARRREATSVRISCAAVVINTALNVALILRFGIAGAAWALVATEMLVFGLCVTLLTGDALALHRTGLRFFLTALPAAVTLHFPIPGITHQARSLLAILVFILALGIAGELKVTRLRGYQRMLGRQGGSI